MRQVNPQYSAFINDRALSGLNLEALTRNCLMVGYVYIIGSEANGNWRTYVGWTTDLDRRLKQHNAGIGAKSTRGGMWILIYAERYNARATAMSREWHLKRDRAFRKMLRPG
jgi:putative endonuclease